MNICIVEKENNYKKNITEEELDKLLTEELKNKYEFDENEFMANSLFFNENYTMPYDISQISRYDNPAPYLCIDNPGWCLLSYIVLSILSILP